MAEILKVGAEFDVSPIIAGAKAAGDSIQQMAAKLKASGLSAEEAASALQNMGVAENEAALAAGVLSEAQDTLNTKIITTSVGASGLERAMAGVTGRALGTEAGLGMVGGALGRIAGYLPGLGPAFAVALPLALLTLFVEKFQEWEKEIEAARKGITDLALSTDELTGKIEIENLKLDDQIAKFEGHPATNQPKIAALEAAAAMEKLGKTIDDDLTKLNKFFENTPGILSNLFSGGDTANESSLGKRLEPLQREYQLAVAAKDVEAQKNILLKEQYEIGLAIDTERQKGTERTGAGPFGAPGAAGSTTPDVKAIQDYQFALQSISNELKAIDDQSKNGDKTKILGGLEQFDAYIKNLEMVRGKVAALNTELNELAADDPRRKAALTELFKGDGFKAEQEGITKTDKLWKEYSEKRKEEIAGIDKATQEQQDRQVKAAEQVARQMTAVGEQERETNLANARADMENAKIALEALKTPKQPSVGIFADVAKIEQAKTEIAALQQQMQNLDGTAAKLKTDIAAIGTPINAADKKTLEDYNAELLKVNKQIADMGTESRRVQAQILTTWQQIGLGMEQSFTNAFNSFNSGFLKMIETGRGFGSAMQQVWNGFAGTIIDTILKIGEKWITQHILMAAVSKIFHIQEVASTAPQIAANKALAISEAGVAGAAGTASFAAAPWPIDLGAPAFGASVFATALGFAAFEQGGMVGGVRGTGVPIIAHPGEIILRENVSAGLTKMFNGGDTPSAGSRNDFHFHASVHSIDSSGVKQFIDKNIGHFARAGMAHLRRRAG